MENRTGLGNGRGGGGGGGGSAADKLVKKLGRVEDQLRDAQHARSTAERQRQELQVRVSTTEQALAAAQQAIFKMERRAQQAYGRVDVEALERGGQGHDALTMGAAGGGGQAPASEATEALVEAKVTALQNLHAQKIKALMTTINALRLQVAKVKKDSSKAGRSKLVQGQARAVAQHELTIDYLKRSLAEEMFRAPALRDDAEGRREAARKVNEDVIKKTLGGPKRFRPKSREELQNELAVAEKSLTRARAREAKSRDGEREREVRHAEALAAARAQGFSDAQAAATSKAEPKEASEAGAQSKVGHDSYDEDEEEDEGVAAYGGPGSNVAKLAAAQRGHKFDAPGSVAALLSEIETLKVAVASRDLNLRAHMDELERLHEELRELKGQRSRFAVVDAKYRQAKADRQRLEGELAELARERQLAEEEVIRHRGEISFLRAGTAADGAALADGAREGEFEAARTLRGLQEKNLSLEGAVRDATKARAAASERAAALERDLAELRSQHATEAAGKHAAAGQVSFAGCCRREAPFSSCSPRRRTHRRWFRLHSLLPLALCFAVRRTSCS